MIRVNSEPTELDISTLSHTNYIYVEISKELSFLRAPESMKEVKNECKYNILFMLSLYVQKMRMTRKVLFKFS